MKFQNVVFSFLKLLLISVHKVAELGFVKYLVFQSSVRNICGMSVCGIVLFFPRNLMKYWVNDFLQVCFLLRMPVRRSTQRAALKCIMDFFPVLQKDVDVGELQCKMKDCALLSCNVPFSTEENLSSASNFSWERWKVGWFEKFLGWQKHPGRADKACSGENFDSIELSKSVCVKLLITPFFNILSGSRVIWSWKVFSKWFWLNR